MKKENNIKENKKISVFSEIGPLKTVVLHRPGKETERLEPKIFERMLFDDIMDYEIAQQEHDAFAKTLKDAGVEVLYVEELVAEVFDKFPKARAEFLERFLDEANIVSIYIREACKKFLEKIKDNKVFVETTIAGIKKTEIKVKLRNTLTDELLEKDEYYFYIDPIPNILFQRDPFASIFNSINIHHMCKETRRRETLYYEFLHKYHPRFTQVQLTYERTNPTSMEGGDILVISEEMIFIAVSERTQAQSVEILAQNLFEKYPKFKRLVAFDIPKGHATMHLDTIITHIDHDTFLMDTMMSSEDYEAYVIERGNSSIKIIKGKMSKILTTLMKHKVKIVLTGGGEILRSMREQWTDGANSLTISPGEIVVYARNKHTNAALKQAGIKIHEIPGSELSRGRGGPRCMAMPLKREKI